MVISYRSFGTTYRSHLKGPFREKTVSCPETSLRNYHYSLRNNPEGRSSHLLRGGSQKSRLFEVSQYLAAYVFKAKWLYYWLSLMAVISSDRIVEDGVWGSPKRRYKHPTSTWCHRPARLLTTANYIIGILILSTMPFEVSSSLRASFFIYYSLRLFIICPVVVLGMRC